MMIYKRGDIVLVDFPFSDQPTSKRRPALIVSSNAYNTSCDDVLIAQITSQTEVEQRIGDHLVQDWREAGLLRPSLIRARLATVDGSLILRRLGVMSKEDITAFGRGLVTALALAN